MPAGRTQHVVASEAYWQSAEPRNQVAQFRDAGYSISIHAHNPQRCRSSDKYAGAYLACRIGAEFACAPSIGVSVRSFALRETRQWVGRSGPRFGWMS